MDKEKKEHVICAECTGWRFAYYDENGVEMPFRSLQCDECATGNHNKCTDPTHAVLGGVFTNKLCLCNMCLLKKAVLMKLTVSGEERYIVGKTQKTVVDGIKETFGIENPLTEIVSFDVARDLDIKSLEHGIRMILAGTDIYRLGNQFN